MEEAHAHGRTVTANTSLAGGRLMSHYGFKSREVHFVREKPRSEKLAATIAMFLTPSLAAIWARKQAEIAQALEAVWKTAKDKVLGASSNFTHAESPGYAGSVPDEPGPSFSSVDRPSNLMVKHRRAHSAPP